MKDDYIKSGDIISCPHCGTDIAEFLQDAVRGQILKQEDIKGLYREILNGEAMVCHKCLRSYYRYGELHIKERGWV